MELIHDIARRFRQSAPHCDFWSVRLVRERCGHIEVREGVLEPVSATLDMGAMVTVASHGAVGYAATSDLTSSGLARAGERALAWARITAKASLIDSAWLPRSGDRDTIVEIPERPWKSLSLDEKVGLLFEAANALKIDERIVDWSAYLSHRHWQCLIANSDGGETAQDFEYLSPGLVAVANRGSETQRRSGRGGDMPRKGGFEILADLGFPGDARRIADEAIALLDAPQCPSGVRSLLLMPSQMVLQIHESIGHPLELDRILGDERNYAGTSFVTPDMFGSYRYGSELLNVTFDPGVAGEIASYGYDDDGSRAERHYLIRNGMLERPLGAGLSQARSGLAGVANARASGWNRPTIDRMANLNVEPGRSSLGQLIAMTESGVLMDTNKSWSIDDSRNKFQFGCEYGRLIENGELGAVVRNPNYRGISASFWRSLVGVGDRSTWRIGGLQNCGKGEPNQSIEVGHAAPVCLFRDVEIFGGEGR